MWNPSPTRRTLRAALLLVLYGAVTMFYGVLVMQFRLPPYYAMRAMRDRVVAAVASPPQRGIYDRKGELLAGAFTRELFDAESQVYPAVSSVSDLSERVRSYLVDASAFPTALQRIEGLEADSDGTRLRVSFDLDGRRHDAYAYHPETTSTGSERCAILIIPGSGENESYRIVTRDPDDYQRNILDLTEPHCRSFVLVKPNEWFLAIHDGRRKLDYEYIVNYLLNQGGSYSAYYIMGAMAVVEFLKGQYDQVYVAGLSQGGAATLLVAIQSQPTGALIASGYSVINETVMPASFLTQIVIPNLDRYYTPNVIRQAIAASSTRFVFSYGRQETAAYRVEAEDGDTCEFFGELENVICVVHDGGHAFVSSAVEALMRGGGNP